MLIIAFLNDEINRYYKNAFGLTILKDQVVSRYMDELRENKIAKEMDLISLYEKLVNYLNSGHLKNELLSMIDLWNLHSLQNTINEKVKKINEKISIKNLINELYLVY